VTSPAGGRNRRRAARVRVTSLVGYSRKRDDHIFQALGTAQALDLSESGLRLRVHEPLPVGGELRFEIALASDLHAATGRIVWGEELVPDRVYEFGVRFVEVDPEVRAALKSFVNVRQEP
jgi:hypothetical protein